MTPEAQRIALECVVANLADGMRWNWTRVFTHRTGADLFLGLLAKEKLIEQREHPSGGLVWMINGKLFGRTDDLTPSKFNELKR